MLSIGKAACFLATFHSYCHRHSSCSCSGCCYTCCLCQPSSCCFKSAVHSLFLSVVLLTVLVGFFFSFFFFFSFSLLLRSFFLPQFHLHLFICYSSATCKMYGRNQSNGTSILQSSTYIPALIEVRYSMKLYDRYCTTSEN